MTTKTSNTHETKPIAYDALLATVICKNCKSKETGLIKNERSDASYSYLIVCKKCDATIGTIRWDDTIRLV